LEAAQQSSDFLIFWHPACLSLVGKQKVLRRMYGQDNQILYSAKFSQGFNVVAARRAWQVAGVSNGGTEIRVIRMGNACGSQQSVVMENRWVVTDTLTCH
jgi:3-oxoacyl-(acyl-carrier-protein) synthase